MKVLITAMKTEEGKKVTFFQTLHEETENIKHELVEVEGVEDKEGFTKEVVFNAQTKKYEFAYVEVPKTRLQEVEEELEKTNQALQEWILSQANQE